jgi:hypothetical protein
VRRSFLVAAAMALAGVLHANSMKAQVPEKQEGWLFDCPLSVTDLQGIFSDLRLGGERSPAQTGTEIRLVMIEGGYRASIRFDGSRVIVAKANVTATVLPCGDPVAGDEPVSEEVALAISTGRYAGKFKGTLTWEALRGTFTFKNGKRLAVDLPRVQESVR